MNKKQRWVLFVGAAVILLMLLFPPFHFRTSDFVQNRGYGCLFDPSEENSTVNTGLLLVQWIGVLLICVILWFALRDRKYIVNYCSQCNARLQPTDKFCTECGSTTELKPDGENKPKIAKKNKEKRRGR
jgi:ribosomal protein L40E